MSALLHQYAPESGIKKNQKTKTNQAFEAL